jgi:hypothetical protein
MLTKTKLTQACKTFIAFNNTEVIYGHDENIGIFYDAKELSEEVPR